MTARNSLRCASGTSSLHLKSKPICGDGFRRLLSQSKRSQPFVNLTEGILLPLFRGSIAEDLGMRDEAPDAGRPMPVGRIEHLGDVTVALCAAGMVRNQSAGWDAGIGAFPFLLTSLICREENSANLPLAERRVSLVGAGCTSRHHFGADQSSMAKKFSSSIPTSALATCARASYAVAALRSMRLTAFRPRDFFCDPSSTI